jgi:DNA-binding NtrC family response regulator
VVEDEPSIRETCRHFLQGLGYTVFAAATPREARQVVTAHSECVRCLLTDVILPEESGWDLAADLVGQDPALRVLFMSGYPPEVIARHGVPSTPPAFLQKPFTRAELARKVRAALDER